MDFAFDLLMVQRMETFLCPPKMCEDFVESFGIVFIHIHRQENDIIIIAPQHSLAYCAVCFHSHVNSNSLFIYISAEKPIVGCLNILEYPLHQTHHYSWMWKYYYYSW